MKVGAHMSTAGGGYSKAVKNVSDIGGNCLQIFSTSPRGWKPANPKEEEKQNFKDAIKEYRVSPVYFHASYLINLAGHEEIRLKSVASIIAELKVAGDFGIKGTVVHLGSFKQGRRDESERHFFEDNPEAYEVLFKSIKEILKETPKKTLFVIENMGMRKIGKSLEEIAFIMESINNKRVRVCLDTCHLHAAGVDLSTEESFELFVKKFEKLIGISFLEFIHINDSKDDFASLRDRHENIGKGKIPEKVFSLLINHPKTKNVPFITEAPGFDFKGPDKENIDRIKSFLKK
jgi:deoxyribonuclease-4